MRKNHLLLLRFVAEPRLQRRERKRPHRRCPFPSDKKRAVGRMGFCALGYMRPALLRRSNRSSRSPYPHHRSQASAGRTIPAVVRAPIRLPILRDETPMPTSPRLMARRAAARLSACLVLLCLVFCSGHFNFALKYRAELCQTFAVLCFTAKY